MNYPVIDFHAHLMSLAGLEKICPVDQKSAFFRHWVPVLEPIAHVTEPVHDRFLRHIAMHYNSELSRSVYSRLGHLFLFEALRLFKRHGLERLIQSMQQHGIKHTVIHSLEPLTDTRQILEETARFPGRFSVFGSISKHDPDPAAYLEPLIRSGAIAGVKLHPMIGGYTAEDIYERTKEAIALAAEHELPVAIHTGHIPIEGLTGLSHCIRVGGLEPLVRAFPKCQFVFTHCGWESWRKALQMAVQYPNILVETSWQPARIIRRAVDTLGAERVLFGSDFPLFQEDQALQQVQKALTAKEFKQVACGNTLRLLKKPWHEVFCCPDALAHKHASQQVRARA